MNVCTALRPSEIRASISSGVTRDAADNCGERLMSRSEAVTGTWVSEVLSCFACVSERGCLICVPLRAGRGVLM